MDEKPLVIIYEKYHQKVFLYLYSLCHGYSKRYGCVLWYTGDKHSQLNKTAGYFCGF